MMNYGNYPFYSSSDEAAIYFNSMCPIYDYQYTDPYQFCQPLSYHYPFYPHYTPLSKADPEAERSTADCEDEEELTPLAVKLEAKLDLSSDKEEEFLLEEKIKPVKKIPVKTAKVKKEEKPIQKRSSSLKKNTEANLINNIVSYVCSEIKSHKAVKKLLITQQRKKIFYIFMKNLKKLNHKYLNRKNVAALLDLAPGSPHEKLLSQSVKRIQILPILELKAILRRLIYDYLRNQCSLVPILTSKKICRVALKENMDKRRELLQYFFKGKEKSL